MMCISAKMQTRCIHSQNLLGCPRQIISRKALDRYEMSINTQSGVCQGKVKQKQGYPEKALAISEK